MPGKERHGNRPRPPDNLRFYSTKYMAKETKSTSTAEWPLWEVFIRSKAGLDHKHAGSLHAADAQMAIENARDVYTRRMEGVSIWVVESKNIHASEPDEATSLYDPANDKIYRHPTFYNLPDEVKYM
jgi:ring-1,2-phenylacetyl-CoA epoxidase subunit PaaB